MVRFGGPRGSGSPCGGGGALLMWQAHEKKEGGTGKNGRGGGGGGSFAFGARAREGPGRARQSWSLSPQPSELWAPLRSHLPRRSKDRAYPKDGGFDLSGKCRQRGERSKKGPARPRMTGLFFLKRGQCALMSGDRACLCGKRETPANLAVPEEAPRMFLCAAAAAERRLLRARPPRFPF